MLTIKSTDYAKILAYIATTDKLKKPSKISMQKILAFLFFSGCRINEALKIKIGDIRTAVAFGEVKIYTSKTNKTRTIYFSQDARDTFKIVFENELKFRNDDDLVFDFSIKSMTDRLNAVIKEALGQNCGGTHGFRRGIITEMIVEKNINPRIVQEFIGHKNVATTLTYFKPTKDDIKSALIR